MNIIGISAMAHDPCVVLLSNKKIEYALEEEKITRRKNEWTFPTVALKELLKKYKNKPIDAVAYYWDDGGNLAPAIMAEMRNVFDKNVPTFKRIHKRIQACQNDSIVKSRIRKTINPHVNIDFHPHHLCHARYAMEMANYSEAVILVVDGRGEYETTSIFWQQGRDLKKIKTKEMPHSLGYLYGAITQFLGFKPNSDEYRVMGLAAYGKKDTKLDDFFESLIIIDDFYRVDTSLIHYQYEESNEEPWLSQKAINALGGERNEGKPITQHHMNIAYALQKRFEDVMFHICDVAKRATGAKNLILTGGCAMNSVMNGKLLTAKLFNQVFVPIAGDQSCAIGAALLTQDKYAEGTVPEIKHNSVENNARPFLGCSYTDEEIEDILLESKLPYSTLTHPEQDIAQLLADNKIVAVFYGELEFGARALGHRSILANPSYPDNRDKINTMIKFRESFRPFAGAILRSNLKEAAGIDSDMPYMNFVLQVEESWKDKIPAIVHVDGSCRFQTVSPNDCDYFYKIINEFNKLTGIPTILNTSFNIKGEPIVRSPIDAIRCFYSTGLEYLVLGKFLLQKV